MSIAILRTAKLKTFGNIAASLAHTYRTRDTPNADPDRSQDNSHSHRAPEEVLEALRVRLPEKRRKDAVLALEFFVGASPQWFEGKNRIQQDAYFHNAMAWLEKRHGRENLVGCSIHRDERSPHLVAYVVPIDAKGKLNAKHWTGGAAVLSKMQTDFARDVAANHGLERGIQGSKARHQKIQDFYAQVEKPAQHATISPESLQPKVLKKGFFSDRIEGPEMVAQRLSASVQQAYAPAVEAAKITASERRRANEMAKTCQILTQQRNEAQERLRALYQHVSPILELATLAKDEVIQIFNHVKQRVKNIKSEQEQNRQTDELDQRLERKNFGLLR